LKTELIGKTPPEANEIGTLGALIYEYTTFYSTLHDNVVSKTEECKKSIENITESDDFKALKYLEGVTALQPIVSQQMEEQCKQLAQKIYKCPNSSRASIEEQLRRSPYHECELSFGNADEILKDAESAVALLQNALDESIDSKLGILLSPKIKERLQHGISEKIISDILACDDVSKLRIVIMNTCLTDQSAIEIINRYLKRVVVKNVKMSEFKPSIKTIEKDQIPTVVKEFEQYMRNSISEIEEDKDDVLPMLQLN